jgi:hypothetical protein
MWFLVRLAFWIGIVLLMLPSAPSQETAEPQFDATRGLAAAIAAVSDMRQFCARQPDACVVGSEAIVAFGQKTQASANLIYDLVNRQANGDGAPLGPRNPEERAHKRSQDTLTLLDRAEPWVNPKPTRRSSGVSKIP